jgi:hypothetical protein
LPEKSAQKNCWQYAVKLILEQADPTRCKRRSKNPSLEATEWFGSWPE